MKILIGSPREYPLFGFLVVGALSTGIDAGVFLLLTWFGIQPVLSSALSFLSAFLVNYKGNQRHVFKARATGSQLARYTALVILNLGLSAGLVWAGIALGMHSVIAKAISMVLIAGFNYFAMKLWVFRPALQDRQPD